MGTRRSNLAVAGALRTCQLNCCSAGNQQTSRHSLLPNAPHLPVELLQDLDGRRLLALQPQAVHGVGQVDGALRRHLHHTKVGRVHGTGVSRHSVACRSGGMHAPSTTPAGHQGLRKLHPSSVLTSSSMLSMLQWFPLLARRTAPPGSASCSRQSRCRWTAPARRWQWAAPAAPGRSCRRAGTQWRGCLRRAEGGCILAVRVPGQAASRSSSSTRCSNHGCRQVCPSGCINAPIITPLPRTCGRAVGGQSSRGVAGGRTAHRLHRLGLDLAQPVHLSRQTGGAGNAQGG